MEKEYYIVPVCNMTFLDIFVSFCDILYARDTYFGTFGEVVHPP